MITQRSTYQAENWTSNTKKPHLVIPQSYFRYEPISLSYDPNEFAHFYNKKSHQNFANFDRPDKGRMNEFFNSFFEIGYSSTRSCQQQRQKTKKIKENLWKKGRLRNWKIRDPGILLALSLSKMHQKNVLVHALFRDPLRKPCRWFLPKIACFEPLKIQKIFIKISIINPKLYKYYNLQQILKIRWKTNLENPSKRATFAKNSPNSAHRLRISLNFISVKWSRPPRT